MYYFKIDRCCCCIGDVHEILIKNKMYVSIVLYNMLRSNTVLAYIILSLILILGCSSRLLCNRILHRLSSSEEMGRNFRTSTAFNMVVCKAIAGNCIRELSGEQFCLIMCVTDEKLLHRCPALLN